MTTRLALIARLCFRSPARALITSMGVTATLLAFVLLQTLIANWYTVSEGVESNNRMIIRHKISIMFPLFTRQVEQLKSVPGVEQVSWFNYFAGKYQGKPEPFGQQAIESESYLGIFTEFRPPAEELKAYLEDATGALVGEELARQQGWKIGDRVTLEGTIYSGTWDLTIRAMYPSQRNVDGKMLFFHWKHLNEKFRGRDHVARLVAKTSGPGVGKDIDRAFAGTALPTKTVSELSVKQEWASWSSGVIAAIRVASLLVLAVLALVLGNSMAMGVRESSGEYAAMRAIGFKARDILVLVMSQGATLVLLGAVGALVVAPGLVEATGQVLSKMLEGSWELELKPGVLVGATAASACVGALAAAVPALVLLRSTVAASLRRVDQ